MSGLPMLVECDDLRVLIVGGGAVAARKAKQLDAAGARLRIVSPELCDELESLVLSRAIPVERLAYEHADIGDAQMIIAATNDRAVNAQVARDCDDASRLLNAADFSTDGELAMMATHKRGALTVGVSAGGVPAAASRIRDAIGERFDARYGDAIAELSSLRARLISSGEAAAWRERARELIAQDFCEAVEDGTLNERIARWR
ncbi:MAG: bifunctional precorrin-2 dehydrogenase/sirohydrochlorin ferrochelatase [Gemmatimonadaceae bacterium]